MIRIYFGKKGRVSKKCFETHYFNNYIELWIFKIRYIWADNNIILNSSYKKLLMISKNNNTITYFYKNE